MTILSGVWLPIVTPFHDGAIDFASYKRLIDHYLGLGISGVFPLGTTGESPTLDDDESEAIVDCTIEAVAGRAPIFIGIGGNSTAKTVKLMHRLERHDFAGIVSVCPYYNRPGQDGLRAHFTAIAEVTARPIAIYNIPYRTAVNMSNDTLLALAELPNIVGVKDSCGSLPQSLDLLRRRPAGFSVMTGEDNFYYTMLAHGGDGGSSPRRTSGPRISSRLTSECRPTTITAHGRSGRGWRRWCRYCSARRTRCRSNTVCGAKG
jgi:4-hydroxy-tetrahydrodipicolinate synthase